MYNAASLAVPRADLMATFMEGGLLFKSLLANKVFSPLSMPGRKGSFGWISVGALTRRDGGQDGIRRAPDGTYPTVDYKLEDGSYEIEESGAEHPIDEAKAAEFGGLLNLERVGTALLMNRLLLEHELQTVSQLHDTATFTGATNYLSVANEWDNVSSGDPVSDVQAGIDAIISKSGEKPNALVVAEKTWRNLWTLDKIRDRIKYVVGTTIPDYTDDAARIQMGKLLGIEEVLIGDVQYNSAAEGETPVIANAWDPEYAVLLKVARTTNMEESCCGRTMYWEANGGMGVFEQYYDDRRRRTILRHRHAIQRKRLTIKLAFLFANIA